MTDYHGFQVREFECGGRKAKLVIPDKPVGGKWIWRTEFFGAFDTVDAEMVRRGYYLAYIEMHDMYGAPAAIDIMAEFSNTLETDCGLNTKPALFGFSRGGLYACQYAYMYPEHVSALYLDAPVLDIRSWPCGLWKSRGNEKNRIECLEMYGITEDEIASFASSPVDRAENLAHAKVPVIIVAGDADRSVPIDENTYPFLERFRKAGGEAELIVKPGCDHHPHSLEDPAPVCDWLEKHM